MGEHLENQQRLWLFIISLTIFWGVLTPIPVFAQTTDTQSPAQTVQTTHSDQDPVVFADPNLAALVAKGLDRNGQPVTYGAIRHYHGRQLTVNDSDGPVVATSLEGLQSLRELPAGIGADIQFDLAPHVSWTPLKGIPVSGSLTLAQDDMHDADFTVVNQIRVLEDPRVVSYREFGLNGRNRYRNATGLTDADIHLLEPVLSQFGRLKHRADDGTMSFAFSNQCLTDFSYFRRFGKVNVVGYGEFVDFKHAFTYIDPTTFTSNTVVRLPARVKGLDGEPVQTSTAGYFGQKLTLDGTDMLVSGVFSGTPWLILTHQQGTPNFSFMDPTVYSDGSLLTSDGMQYYRLKWQKAPVAAAPAPKPSPPTRPGSKPGKPATVPPRPPTPNRPQPALPPNPTTHPQPMAHPRVVYATKTLYRYQRATFTHQERLAKYAQQPRANRPLFVILSEARSHAGRRRYFVRDINHGSATDGQTGYVTADPQYVTSAYYQSTPPHVTVINPAGVVAHRQPNLSAGNPVTRCPQGTVLSVVAFQRRHLTTRFQLANGTYITANRRLVRAGVHPLPKALLTKAWVTRFSTASLTKRMQTYAPGTRLKVLGWTNAHPDDLSTASPRRYRIPGGYVTANTQKVRLIW